jgi:hypothetical protein
MRFVYFANRLSGEGRSRVSNAWIAADMVFATQNGSLQIERQVVYRA